MINKQFIENMKEFPMCIIGDAVTDFYKYYEGPVVSVSDDSELKDVIAYYSGISNLGRPLVISDISFVTGSNTILLKFLEESTLDIVLLSRYDKLDEIVSSRLKKIVKYYNTKTESKFMSPSQASNIIEDQLSQDTSYYDKIRYQGKYCPKLLMLDKTIRSSKVKSKILSIL